MFEHTPIIGYRYGGTIDSSQTDLFNRDVNVGSHMNYGLNFGIPIANGVLTSDTEEQARARAAVKGAQAARVAVEMANTLRSIAG